MVAQDFIKGWPHPDLLERPELKAQLKESFSAALADGTAASALNYGTAAQGAFMLGQPEFLQALAQFLGDQYGVRVDPSCLMATGGASMGTDLCCRVHAQAGDIAVSEAPTYYLAHQMFKERGLELREVPIEADGMDLDALEAVVKECAGKVKIVYTVPVNHNPTSVTMSNAKRERLMAMAREHRFVVIADEAYQLLNFGPCPVRPLFYHDDPNDPRCLSISTLSKLVGPGVKVGWIQAAPELLKPLAGIGFINSGNNPVIFMTAGLTKFVETGLKEHIEFVSAALGAKRDVLCEELEKQGFEFTRPNGGYFVWVKSRGKMTGRSGAGMSLDPPDAYKDYMRLCFAWLTPEQIREGIEFLKE